MRRLIVVMALAMAAWAQVDDKSTERKSFPGVRDLVIDNVNGFIEVTAGTGGNVEMEVEKTLRGDTQDRLAIARREVSLSVRQEGGLLQLMVDGPFRCHCSDNSINFRGGELYRFTYDFKVRVPRDVHLELRTVNNSHITVEGTSGDYKISNVNGGIEMREVEGSGSVHTVNGPVKVVFARNPKSATSFRSVNGTLDVSFRTGLNADLKMKTFNGSMFTDFEVGALPPAPMQQVEKNGKLVWRRDRTTGVRVGSGGPELSFDTLNGNVLIRNREK